MSGYAPRRAKPPKPNVQRECLHLLRLWGYHPIRHNPVRITGWQGKNLRVVSGEPDQKGAPDILVPVYRGLVAVECKSGKDVLSADQKRWQAWCADMEIPYLVVRSTLELERFWPVGL